MRLAPSVGALDDAIRRLMLDGRARAAFLADPASLGVDERTAQLLAEVDHDDLSRLGRAVLRGVASGSLCGTDLESTFPSTLAHLGGGTDEIAGAFLASPEFADVSIVGNRPGHPVARAFHSWVLARTGDPVAHAAVHQEYVRATMVVLATTADPYFDDVDSAIRPLPGGWLAVLDDRRSLDGPAAQPDHPIVVVVARGRLWGGPVSLPVCASLLRMAGDPPSWALEAVDQSLADQIGEELRLRGLL